MRIESLLEGARLGVDQLRANKFRSMLTVLGIVVGVATVMAMSAAVTGVRSSVLGAVEAAGPRNFSVMSFNLSDVNILRGPQRPTANPPISLAEARQLALLPGIQSAIPVIDPTSGIEIVHGSQRLPAVAVVGRGAGWSAFTNGDFLWGNDFLQSDVLASSPVAVLTPALAEEMFGDLNPIGRVVRMNGQPFTVVGVFQPRANIFAELQRHFAVIPYTASLKHLRASADNLGVFMVTAPHATQNEAMDQAIAAMRTMRGLRPGEENNFAVLRSQEIAETFDRLTAVFFAVMIALSSVALMVGGVGVIAIMMIAVTERTREIGVRKALGATRREILWQFLFEATTVTVIGGVIGIALGAGGAFLVASLTPIPAAVPLGGLVAALGMAIVAGMLFGIWPAWRASKLDPVEALRYE
jgi:putative ABC transport system permease protein